MITTEKFIEVASSAPIPIVCNVKETIKGVTKYGKEYLIGYLLEIHLKNTDTVEMTYNQVLSLIADHKLLVLNRKAVKRDSLTLGSRKYDSPTCQDRIRKVRNAIVQMYNTELECKVNQHGLPRRVEYKYMDKTKAFIHNALNEVGIYIADTQKPLGTLIVQELSSYNKYAVIISFDEFPVDMFVIESSFDEERFPGDNLLPPKQIQKLILQLDKAVETYANKK